jgi:hypothetical protein
MKLHLPLKKVGFIICLTLSGFSSISQTITPVKQDYAVGKSTEVKGQVLGISDEKILDFVLRVHIGKQIQSDKNTKSLFKVYVLELL